MLEDFEAQRQSVIQQIEVTTEMVTQAQDSIASSAERTFSKLWDLFMKEQGIAVPSALDLDADDIEHVLKSLARAYSWQLAFIEATWTLIRSGVVLTDYKTDRTANGLRVRTTRRTTSWRFPELDAPYPQRLYSLPSDQFDTTS